MRKRKLNTTRDWRGISWREPLTQTRKSYLYRRMEDFLKHNPHLNFARLVDLALANFFSADPKCEVLFMRDRLMLEPNLDFLKQQREATDSPPHDGG